MNFDAHFQYFGREGHTCLLAIFLQTFGLTQLKRLFCTGKEFSLTALAGVLLWTRVMTVEVVWVSGSQISC